jgi:AbrB family looped-hinge helix DNA binding protein
MLGAGAKPAGDAMQRIKVGRQFQIALPANVRRELGSQPGDQLPVEVRGNHLLLMREPEDYAAALAGLHAEVWDGIDPQAYIRELREACSH